ncbi:hypothetical protein MMC22_008639 [Lobaria immixta]|nr:hypothetical protein [Lobaria immixta]
MTLTNRETETLAAAFRSIKGPVKIDFEKVASITGYKTAASANFSFFQIKKKLKLNDMGTGNQKAGSNDDGVTTRTPRKRGRKPKVQDNADENAEVGITNIPKKPVTESMKISSQEPKPPTASDIEGAGDGNGRVDSKRKKRKREDVDDPASTSKRSKKKLDIIGDESDKDPFYSI